MGAGEVRTPLYVCVHLPEFPAQAMLRSRPELAGEPVVVLAGTPPLDAVCSANRHALRLGVLEGTTRAELDSFPGVRALKRSAPEERVARAALVEAAGAFTPRVEVLAEADAQFAMVLDMTGTERVFGPVGVMLERVIAAVRGLRLHARLAASANFETAVRLAPTAVRRAVVTPAGREAEWLRGLPLSVLRLTHEQQEMFALWGLNTVGDFAALPETELVVRLGQEGKRLLLLARGEHPHLMQPAEPVLALEEYIAFDAPVEMLDSLLFVVGPMVDQLLTRAMNHAFALASVTLTLGLDGGGEHVRVVKPALPVAERDVLLKLMHLDLVAHPPAAGVMSVRVQAEPGDRSKVQMGLFSPQLPEPMRLDVTLARIAALVGEDRVGRVRLLDTHRPDSFAMERFTVPGKVREAEPRERAAVALRRCRPAQRLAVFRTGARPAGFAFAGRRYAVEEAYGPWRKSGEWWSGGAWSCEEWDVRARAAEAVMLCVVAHDLLTDEWRLEAMYD